MTPNVPFLTWTARWTGLVGNQHLQQLSFAGESTGTYRSSFSQPTLDIGRRLLVPLDPEHMRAGQHFLRFT
jgi:hypothetical protein